MGCERAENGGASLAVLEAISPQGSLCWDGEQKETSSIQHDLEKGEPRDFPDKAYVFCP